MEKQKRVNYIDTLKGLCVLWIIWYHTFHPQFVNYPFFNTTLFFVSGILFKPDPINTFLKKKFNQLIVPFLFFYIAYYVFLLCINFIKYRSIESVAGHITDIFHLYTGNEAFIVNYPLWFICAIFVLQIITYILNLIVKNKTILVAISLAISLLGYYYIQWIPTPIMFGRALPYLIYFIIGYVSKGILLNESSMDKYKKNITFTCLATLLISLILKKIDATYYTNIIYEYIELISVAYLLTVLCKEIQNISIIKAITFFGINSLIVLGLHDMYLTTFMITIQNTIGNMNIILGLLNFAVTCLILWPSIIFLNKYLPFLVAKKEILTTK